MAKHVSYTVKAVQREDAHYSDGRVAQHAGAVIYLDFVDEGGGWPQWSIGMPTRTPWNTPERALSVARKNDQMPWWNKPDMNSLQVVRLTNVADFSAEII